MIGRRFRIQTILLTVNLIVLLLPVGSIFFLKLFEDERVQQTEVELAAQGAAFVTVYQQFLMTAIRQKRVNIATLGTRISDNQKIPLSLNPNNINISIDHILPARPDPVKPNQAPNPFLLSIGKRMSTIFRQTQLTTMASMRLLDSNGIVIASSRGETGLSYGNLEEVREALKGEVIGLLRYRSDSSATYSFFSTTRDTGLHVFVAIPVIIDRYIVGAILLSRTPKSVKKMLFDKKEPVIIAFAILLFIVILLTALTSLTITRPLKSLIRQTKEVAIGNFDQKPRLKRPGVQEIHLLTKAFAEMTERIEHRSNYIHHFAMHVSHEFKSPLTSIQGAIELLQNYYEDMPVKRRKRFFRNIAQDTDRLQRLVTRLLELARADVFEPGEEQTDLVGLLEQQHEQYQSNGLEIHLKNTITSFLLPIGKEVLETITANLFENSKQHGAEHIMIEIIEGKSKIVRFYDDGEGISAANAEKIFTPFFTTNRKKGGTGLGLQIIQSLLKAHHATIKHVPTVDGALFEIEFENRLELTVLF